MADLFRYCPMAQFLCIRNVPNLPQTKQSCYKEENATFWGFKPTHIQGGGGGGGVSVRSQMAQNFV